MFISNYEKEQLRISIRKMEQELKVLQSTVFLLTEKINEKKASKVIFKTEEAPWGYKKDGTPRKRPGRPIQPMKVSP